MSAGSKLSTVKNNEAPDYDCSTLLQAVVKRSRQNINIRLEDRQLLPSDARPTKPLAGTRARIGVSQNSRNTRLMQIPTCLPNNSPMSLHYLTPRI